VSAVRRSSCAPRRVSDSLTAASTKALTPLPLFVVDIGASLYVTVVTVTTTFSKCKFAHFHIKKYKFFLYTLEFGQENRSFPATRSFLWPKTCRKCDITAGAPPRTPLGELTTLLQTLYSRLVRGHPSPYPTPLGAFGASMLAALAPRSSCPPDTKSWRRHWSPPLSKVKLRLWSWT